MVSSDELVRYLRRIDYKIFVDKFSGQIRSLADKTGHIQYHPPKNDHRFYYRKGRWMRGDQLLTPSGTLVGTALSNSFPEWKVLLDVLDKEYPIEFKELCSQVLPIDVPDVKESRREFRRFLEWGSAIELYSMEYTFKRAVREADKYVDELRREQKKLRKRKREK
jgi:hypothetical protein